MADAKSNYLENAVLDWVLGGSTPTRPTTRYVALFTATPSDTGGGTEVTGGSYARQTSTWTAASGGSSSNAADIVYANMPGATVTHFGVFDAVTGGNLLYYGAFTTPKSPTAGDTATVSAGTLVISEL